MPRWKMGTKSVPWRIQALRKHFLTYRVDAALCLYLFPSKYVLVEVKLNLLIGDVYAELLKRVLFEVLKPKDVQDADVQALVILPGGDKNEK